MAVNDSIQEIDDAVLEAGAAEAAEVERQREQVDELVSEDDGWTPDPEYVG